MPNQTGSSQPSRVIPSPLIPLPVPEMTRNSNIPALPLKGSSAILESWVKYTHHCIAKSRIPISFIFTRFSVRLSSNLIVAWLYLMPFCNVVAYYHNVDMYTLVCSFHFIISNYLEKNCKMRWEWHWALRVCWHLFVSRWTVHSAFYPVCPLHWASHNESHLSQMMRNPIYVFFRLPVKAENIIPDQSS